LKIPCSFYPVTIIIDHGKEFYGHQKLAGALKTFCYAAHSDRLQQQSLNHRYLKHQVLLAVVNEPKI
jgi:IS30 family transposase